MNIKRWKYKLHIVGFLFSILCFSSNFTDVIPTPFESLVGLCIPGLLGGYTFWYILSFKTGIDMKSCLFVYPIWMFLVFTANGVISERDFKKNRWKKLQEGDYYLLTARFSFFVSGNRYLRGLYDNRKLSDFTENIWGDKYQSVSKDTVLVKQTLSGYSEVVNTILSAEEKKKYFIPVLYIDNVEQKNFTQEEYNEAMHKSHKRLGFVFEKRKFGLLRIGVADSLARPYVFSEKSEQYDSVYQALEVGDTVVIRVSDVDPNISDVLIWKPTSDEINKYRTPVKLIEEEIRIGTICSKEKKKYEQDSNIQILYYIQIQDSAFTSEPIQMDKIDGLFLYTRLNIGDPVLYRYVNGETKIINWEPTPKEINLYNHAQKIPNSPIAIVNKMKKQEKYVGKGTIKKMHYMVQLRIGNHITNYFDIDDMYRRQIYESLKEGDTVIIQKPKSNSEKIQVLSWEPSPEEIEKYRTQVRGTEITDN